MKFTMPYPTGVVLLLALLGACNDDVPLLLEPQAVRLNVAASPPAGLVPITVGSKNTQIWPYTGTSLAGTPQDPINLVFTGVADPRNVRNALMSVDGVRAGPLAPFDCVWKDAIGGQQATYSELGGWGGSVIQLECGDYDPFRFHIRVFPAGGWAVANAHVDVLIPGTTDHQVLTWELGEQMVTYDLARRGFLVAAPAQTGAINAAGTFREIPAVIYNGLPNTLKGLTGGPFTPVAQPVGIPTNGSATVLALADAPTAEGTEQEFELTFGQFIPKPFCNSGNDYVRVDGPVRLRQRVHVSSSGVLSSQTFVEGELSVRSFNPVTGAVGAPFPAKVAEHYRTLATGANWTVSSTRDQRLATAGGTFEVLAQSLKLGAHGRPAYKSSESCS